MQELVESIKRLASWLTQLFERANKSTLFFILFILVLSFVTTIPIATREPRQELWTIVSMNIADNLLSGKGLVSTVDPAVSSAPISPLLWPGPVAIVWATLWKIFGLKWMIEPAIALICILLIGLIVRRIELSMGLIAVTMCILHPQLASSIHSRHDLLLSLALFFGAVLMVTRQNLSWKSAIATALLLFLAFLTSPIWLLALVTIPLAFCKQTSKATQTLTLIGSILAAFLLVFLKATDTLSPFLQLHQISDLPWDRTYSAIIPLWMNFVSHPSVLVYLIFWLHGFRERKKTSYQQVMLWLSIFSIALFLMGSLSYYSITYMDVHSYALLLLLVSLPVASFGFKQIIAALSSENEGRTKLAQALFLLVVIYVMGISMIQKQLSQAVYYSDNKARIEQQKMMLQAARKDLPSDEWLLIVDGWDLASGMSNIIIPNTKNRQLLTEHKVLQVAHPFSGAFFSETSQYAYKIRLPDGTDTSSWQCISKEGYRFCKKV